LNLISLSFSLSWTTPAWLFTVSSGSPASDDFGNTSSSELEKNLFISILFKKIYDIKYSVMTSSKLSISDVKFDMQVRTYGWIFAGWLALIYSVVYTLLLSGVWTVAILALKKFHHPKCLFKPFEFLVSSKFRELTDGNVQLTELPCVDGYIPIGQGVFLTFFSLLSIALSCRLGLNPNRPILWAALASNLLNLALIGVLTVLDFGFIDMNIWRNHHADEIKNLFQIEASLAAFLTVQHLSALGLTFLSLLQPLSGNCF